MTAQASRPIVLALFAKPSKRRAVVEKLASVHGFGTIVVENEGEFWARIAMRKPDIVLLEHGHLGLCRSLSGFCSAIVVIIDETLTCPLAIVAQFEAAIEAGARGVCLHPLNPTVLANMINAATSPKGEVAYAGR